METALFDWFVADVGIAPMVNNKIYVYL